jgi:NNP family nitrate/nitrite transporter-like MFS transporter
MTPHKHGTAPIDTRPRYADALLLASCWTIACIGAMYLIVPSGILSVIQQRLSIGPGAAGWIISVPYAAEALCAVPLGVLLDRTTGRRLLLGGVLLVAAVNAAGALTGEAGLYVPFLFSRVLGGVAYMAIWLSAIRLVSERFPERTATAVGVLTTSGPAGLAIGLSLGPAVLSEAPWHHVFWVLIALVGPAGLLALVATRGTRAGGDRDERVPNPMRALRTALRSRSLLLVALMSFAAYSLFLLFSSWMPSFLADSYGLSLARSSLLASVFPAVGILARSGGGVVSDYVFDGDARRVLTVSFVALPPVVCGIAVGTSAGVLVVLLLAAGFFVQTGIGLYFSYGPAFVVDSAEGTAVAVINTAGLTGSFTAPIIAGTIVGVDGDFTTVFGYALLLTLLGLGSALLLPVTPGARGG